MLHRSISPPSTLTAVAAFTSFFLFPLISAVNESQIHDDCVGDQGLMNIKCHEEFKKCIREVKETGKVGFSESCPYEKAMPTMIQGMDMAILFSQFGQPKDEL